MTQQTLYLINTKLDAIEARMDEINSKLSRIVEELDKYDDKNKSSKRTITSTYDGEIMYRFKSKNNNNE
jgi:hypothetical protein